MEIPLSELPKPGEILCYDYRVSRNDTSQLNSPKPLKLLQWNIERGYQMNRIIEILKDCDADILALQELDIGCARSGYVNTALEIAKELKLCCVFVSEFIEIYSPSRSESYQGGGVHGNAILSKYDLIPRVLDHKYQPYNWERDGHLLNEPRLGKRYTMVAEVVIPQRPSILVYSVHLEVLVNMNRLKCFVVICTLIKTRRHYQSFTIGMMGRICQISEVFQDSMEHPQFKHQLIFGDFNTMAHGIARFSRKYCRDQYRWRSIGYSEAEWWYEHFLTFAETEGPSNTLLANHPLPSDVLRMARNPGFVDPFHPTKDFTFIHSHSIYKGKLDWTLIRMLNIVSFDMLNNDFKASDHKALVVEVEYPEQNEVMEQSYFERWENERMVQRRKIRLQALFRRLLFGCSFLAVGAMLTKLLKSK